MCDPAPSGDLPEAARRAGIEVLPGSTVLGTEGDLRVRAIALGEVGDGQVRASRRIDCDTVLMSGGFTPSVHLFSQSRGKLAWNEPLQAFVPGQSAECERSAGACRGVSGLAQALVDGATAGADAAAPDGRSQRRGTRAFVVDTLARGAGSSWSTVTWRAAGGEPAERR